MQRRLFTRQHRADRRRQLLRDLVLGAVVVAIAQIVAPRLPFVEQLEAEPVGLGTPAFIAAAIPGHGR